MRNAVGDSASPDDAGLGLIELIVAMVVASLVIAAAATILVNSWLTQQDVTTTTQATNRGQVMGAMIERAVRNAKAMRVYPADDAGTELRVWTTLGGGLECQGFQLTSGQARLTTTAGSVLPVASSWGEWDSTVIQHGSEPFFVRVGDTLTYTFDLATDSAPVQFSGEVAARYVEVGGSPCW